MSPSSTSMWQERGQFFEHARHRIFWIEGGLQNAPVLVLIHGFPTSSWDWQAVWPELGKHYRLIALDMLGFGFSDKPRGHSYTISEQADIHEALLQSLGIADYHLLAHDYGDTVAQELIARDLESTRFSNLRSVCLLNGGLFPETHRLLTIQKLLLSPLGPWVARMTRRKRLERSMQRIFGAQTQPDETVLEGFWNLINCNDGAPALAGLIAYIPERIRHRQRWVGALQGTPRPLLLINGMSDPISGAHMVQRYRELIQPARIVELDGIGHYPQIEAAQQVVDAYLKFAAAVGESSDLSGQAEAGR
ncbi:MAG TPA: alpha/beta hydrolase [Dokdonella sp.]|uniref:alpha/beta fold hydrolase n=1 Tax=Dokdonella sp. TaxID=2291710 RepID=UPI002D7E3A12|nr:alpha/beta hydrolase [Dokdonella sp.]HET9032213.1 alpha/beta hydrolase [Dokdonella sp.]